MKRVSIADLENIRRQKKKALRAVARGAGLTLCAVWRVLHRRSFDLRKIAAVSREIGVHPHRLDLESFLQPESKEN